MKRTFTFITGQLVMPLVNLPPAEPARAPYNELFVAIDDMPNRSNSISKKITTTIL
jgi:hypothetical protein